MQSFDEHLPMVWCPLPLMAKNTPILPPGRPKKYLEELII
jgi:hypothetical protein